MTACPTCGHPVPDDYVPGLILSPEQKKIFKIVCRRSPEGISQDDLANILYADRRDGGPNNAQVTIRTTIYNINRKLIPYRLRILGRGGYRLTGVGNAE